MRQRAVAFDTLAFVKKIESSGLELKQAESIAEAISDVFEKNLSDSIFTKEDGALLRSELKTDIAELRAEVKTDIARLETNISDIKSELKTDIAEVKSDISKLESIISKVETKVIMWVVGLLLGQSAVMISILMKFIH